MGTRSIIRVIADDQVYVHMYQQFDGYLAGVGKELFDLLKDMHIVNGYNDSTPKPFANGAGCLAAQIVAHFKAKPGGCYLQPVDSDGEEFNYDVIVQEASGWLGGGDKPGRIRIKVNYYDTEWEGNVAEFGELIQRDAS